MARWRSRTVWVAGAALLSLPPALVLPALVLSPPAAGSVAAGGRVGVPPAPVAAPVSAWAWPLAPEPAVLRPFRAPPERWSAGHRGVDLVASVGQQVLAPAAGTVTFAGPVVDRGVVVLTHANGLRTSFEPVTAVVVAGATVDREQVVAVVDVPGAHCAWRPCLHWGVRRGEVYVDPLRLLEPPPPSVLLPMGPAGSRASAGAPGRRAV